MNVVSQSGVVLGNKGEKNVIVWKNFYAWKWLMVSKYMPSWNEYLKKNCISQITEAKGHQITHLAFRC